MICTACGEIAQQGTSCVGCGAQLRNPTPPAAAQVTRSGPARAKGAEAYLQLQRSEGIVTTAAANIFAAYISAGQVSEANAAAMIETSVRHAIQVATLTDQLVQSDDEEW